MKAETDVSKKQPVAVTLRMSWGAVMILVIKFAVCSFVFTVGVALATALVLSLLAPAIGQIFTGLLNG